MPPPSPRPSSASPARGARRSRRSAVARPPPHRTRRARRAPARARRTAAWSSPRTGASVRSARSAARRCTSRVAPMPSTRQREHRRSGLRREQRDADDREHEHVAALTSGCTTRSGTFWSSSTSSTNRARRSPRRLEARPSGASGSIRSNDARADRRELAERRIMPREPLEVSERRPAECEGTHADDRRARGRARAAARPRGR